MDIAKELEEPYEDVDKLIDHMDLEIALGNRKLESQVGEPHGRHYEDQIAV